MAAETPEEESAAADNPTMFRALDQLRPHLSMLMGGGGYQALLARALVRASAEVPWLTAVQVIADGELQTVTGAELASMAVDIPEGEEVLLAQLLGLLVAFIGQALTMRLIIQMWPQISFDDADFSDTPSKGKAK